jgi:hypothetical protein
VGTHTHHRASVLGSPKEGVGGSRLSEITAVDIVYVGDSMAPVMTTREPVLYNTIINLIVVVVVAGLR